MNSDPGPREDGDKVTPNLTLHEVGTMISRQRVIVDRWDGAGVDRGSLNQVVGKDINIV